MDTVNSDDCACPPFPWRTLTLLLAVLLAVIVPFLLFGASVDAWAERVIARAAAHPFSTGALLTLLLASDILMPVPSSLVSTACGMTLGFAMGTLASFSGMSITTVAGYLIGRYASAPAEQVIGKSDVAFLRRFHERHGLWLLLALRPVPVLAEASVLFFGLSRRPFLPMLAVTAAGNLAVSAVYAAVGAWGKSSDSFLPAFGASILLSGVLLLGVRFKRKAA